MTMKKRLFLLALPSILLGFLVSCGSGPKYQEPAYEINNLPPKPKKEKAAPQPDFEVPNEPVSRNDFPVIERPKPPVAVIPLAKGVPGRPGWVYNPFNQNIVDVEGVPSGTKVIDPMDKDETHVFKVP